MWCAIADPRYTLMCQNFRLDRFILSPSVGEKSQFLPFFWTSAFSVVASWQQSVYNAFSGTLNPTQSNPIQSDKVEHGCTTTNLSLSKGIKIVSVLQCLHGEIGRAISDVQKRDGQTDRQTNKQTKKLNVFGHPGGG